MAYWKPSFASLSTYFTCESQHDKFLGQNAEITAATPENEAQVKSSSSADVRRKLNAMVHDVWEEIFANVCKSHPRIIEDLYSSADVNTENNLEVKVVKEVFKREMVIALEHIYRSRLKPESQEKSVEPVREKHGSMNALKQRLAEMSEKAVDTEKALLTAVSQRHDLQCICEQHEEEQQKTSKMLQDATEENEKLRKKIEALVKHSKLLKAEMKELRDAKSAEEMKALRSQHDAEMAHLIAKQSVLQAKLMDKQLREAESSSEIVQKRVEELQMVQNEMRSALVNSSRPSGSHVAGAQNQMPMHRSSRLLGKLGMVRTLAKQKAGGVEGVGRTGIGTGSEFKTKRQYEETEGSAPPTVFKQFGSGGTNRNRGETQQRARRKFIGRQNGANREPAAAAGGREERGRILNRLRKLGRGVPGHTNREAEVGQGMKVRLPWLAELTRLLSPNTPSHTLGVQQSVGVSSQTLDALGENLEALRDVVENKQKEVDRLRGELRAATQLSDTLEQRLRQEQHMNVQKKHSCPGCVGVSSAVAGTGTQTTGEIGFRNRAEFEEVNMC